MNSASRKVLAVVSLAAAAGVTLAAFTSPPFNYQPTRTEPMVWQCYSALVERTSVVCSTPPLYPTNVIPARTHWYLLQCKAQVLALAASGEWTHPSLPGYFTNRITTNSILQLAGLGADFWTNTPPAGQATATNGWHGLRRVITNLVWTAAVGAPSGCGGSNVSASASGFKCSTNPLTFWATSDGFPLYEGRNYSRGTNNVYKGYEAIDEIEGSEPCDTPWRNTGTNYFYQCEPVTSNLYYSGGECTNGVYEQSAYRHRIDQLIIITDACDPEFALGSCPVAASEACAHYAPITFTACTNALTNITFTADEYYNSGATGTCAGATATFTDPFGVGLVSTGWAKLFTYTATNGSDICRTNFANATTHWTGIEVTNAWAIYGAVMVKKWNFNY